MEVGTNRFRVINIDINASFISFEKRKIICCLMILNIVFDNSLGAIGYQALLMVSEEF